MGAWFSKLTRPTKVRESLKARGRHSLVGNISIGPEDNDDKDRVERGT